MKRAIFVLFLLFSPSAWSGSLFEGRPHIQIVEVTVANAQTQVTQLSGDVYDWLYKHNSVYINLGSGSMTFYMIVRTYSVEDMWESLPIEFISASGLTQRACDPYRYFNDEIWIAYRKDYPQVRWYEKLFPVSAMKDGEIALKGFKTTAFYGSGFDDDGNIIVTGGNPVSGIMCESSKFELKDGGMLVLPSHPIDEYVVSRQTGVLVGKYTVYGYHVNASTHQITGLSDVQLEYINAEGKLERYPYSKAVNAFLADVELDTDGDGWTDIQEILYGSNPLHPDKVPVEGGSVSDPNADLEQVGGGDEEGTGEYGEQLDTIIEQLEKLNGGEGGLHDAVTGLLSEIINKLTEVKDAVNNNSGGGGGSGTEPGGEDGEGGNGEDGDDYDTGYKGEGLEKPENTELMVFEYDYSESLDGIKSTFDKTNLGLDKLQDFSPKEYSYTIEYPIGGRPGSVRWGRYDFSLTKFPSEVNSSINTIREWVGVLCKALMTLLFVRHVFALLWRF